MLSPLLGPATGRDPCKRYAEGARQRGETGLVIACIGAGKHSYNVFSGSVAPGIHLPGHHGQISASPLPAGVSPELTDGLDHAEYDLATRLLNPPRTPGSARPTTGPGPQAPELPESFPHRGRESCARSWSTASATQ
ncbi:hypothetical protein [Streptomyces sp. CFMR 7]|uniref:hypothetical protein n=1 Tax=Streptomyces sp. CFMR 7 TaxID=1649184 RepID=UPI0021B6959D|nr:hypothetical protein [Streptomyces sp. CFMR 7]